MNIGEIDKCKSVVIPAYIVNGATIKTNWDFSINNMDFIPDYAILTSVHSLVGASTNYVFAISCYDMYPNPFISVPCANVSYNVQTIIPLGKFIQNMKFQIGEVQPDNSIGEVNPVHVGTPWVVNLTFDFVKIKRNKK